MGKRSDFERVERDYYPTPISAVYPLVQYLPDHGVYAEPCAGDGRLIEHIKSLTNLSCKIATDIEPQSVWITPQDAFAADFSKVDFVITNPPWERRFLHGFIEYSAAQAPTWLLFDADWMHTKQSAALMEQYCSKVVSVGRVKWIEGSKGTGKDNCAWYLFDQRHCGATQFFGRATNDRSN